LSVVVGVSGTEVKGGGAELDMTGGGGVEVSMGRGLKTHTPNAISPSTTTPPMMTGFFQALDFLSS
jgi:hypothetical protein